MRILIRLFCIFLVAPFAGAWIEIVYCPVMWGSVLVAPFAGAWIEMALKQWKSRSITVAPFAGAWIESGAVASQDNVGEGRTLRGCVD